MSVTCEIKGLKELDAALVALERKTSRQIGGKAIRAGARIIQNAAKAMVHSITGTLRDAIKVRTGKDLPNYRSVQVGVGKKWFEGPAWYGAFVEFGHKVGKKPTRKKSRLRKHFATIAAFIPAEPIKDARKAVEGEHMIEYAYDENAQAGLNAVIANLSEGIDKAVNDSNKGAV